MRNLLSIIFFSACLFDCQSKDATPTKTIESSANMAIAESVKEALHSSIEIDSSSIEIDSTIGINYLMGQFVPAQNGKFALIDQAYSSRSGMYLRKEAYEAFIKMSKAAKKQSISLTILSATRNFATQKSIWESKWTGQRRIENGKDASKAYPVPKDRALKILEYSSMPGTSRHHWGTDLDLNNLTNAYFSQGKGLKVYQWLQQNAGTYGFCQPYTAGREHGYKEEKWHWSYMPIARGLTIQAQLRLTDHMIKGFKGAETAKEIKVISKYVLGINQDCL